MRALNRKSSVTSLPMNDIYQNNNEMRGSVPPDHKLTANMTPPRAKSVSKEPVSRDNSKSSNKDSSVPSRFFSLSRRIAKIRFSSSSQPPPPIKNPLPTNLPESLQTSTSHMYSESPRESDLKLNGKPQQVQIVVNHAPSEEREKSPKRNIRERALSPSRILRSLRPRSPFTRSSKSASKTQPEAQPPNLTMVSGATSTITGKNKSFTVSTLPPSMSSSVYLPEQQNMNKSQQLMSASYHASFSNDESSSPSVNNRFMRATTAGPSMMSDRLLNVTQSMSGDKTRSQSCEFIENSGVSGMSSLVSYALKQLNETLDENDESNLETSNYSNSPVPSSSYNKNGLEEDKNEVNEANNQQNAAIKLNNKKVTKLNSFNSTSSSAISRVEALKKHFDTTPPSMSMSEVVKSVKFKEPTDKSQPQQPQISSPQPELPVINEPKKTTSTNLTMKAQETKLMQVLDEALLSTPSSLSTSSSASQTASSMSNNSSMVVTEEKEKSPNSKKLNVKFSSTTTDETEFKSPSPKLRPSVSVNNVEKPPKPPMNAALNIPPAAPNNLSAFNFRAKLSGIKSRTIDFPESSNHQSPDLSTQNATLTANIKSSNSINGNINNPILTSSGRPIQSILRRSETPPTSKNRQTSIDSTDSNRETSIEKILKSTTSTSRPLIFNS